MGAPDVLAHLSALGVRLSRDGDFLIAEPRSALTDEARAMIRAHKAKLLEALRQTADGDAAQVRKARALAFLEAHPNVKRACFADVESDPAHVILTVALREPWGAMELLVRREKFDALVLMELSLRYPDTAVSVSEH
jgi:hypothetical protein